LVECLVRYDLFIVLVDVKVMLRIALRLDNKVLRDEERKIRTRYEDSLL
jgi:hypothetical protein